MPPELQTTLYAIIGALGLMFVALIGLARAWIRSRSEHMAERIDLKDQIETNRAASEKFMREAAERGQRERDELTRRLDALTIELNKARQALIDAQLQFAHDQGELQGQIKTLAAQNVDFAVRLASRDKQIETLTAQIDTQAGQITELKRLNDQKDQALAVSNREKDAMRKEMTRLEQEVLTLKSRIGELELLRKHDTGPLPALADALLTAAQATSNAPPPGIETKAPEGKEVTT